MKPMTGRWVVKIYESTGPNCIYSDYFSSRSIARAYAKRVKEGLREVDRVEVFQDKEGFMDIVFELVQNGV